MIEIPGYMLEGILYEGKQTFVYRAKRNSDNFPVIIKILRQEHPPYKHIAQLQHEYMVVQKIDSSKIVQAYGLEVFRDRLFLVLEDFGGESLTKLIQDGKIDLNNFLWIAIELAQGLGEIHQQQIIHKDIKPHNIIVNLQTKQVKITDFGISTFISREIQQIATPESLEGTVAYISPEQTGRTNHPVDYRTDIYSLGITLYEMTTGKVPFQSKDFIELVYSHIAVQPKSPHEVDHSIPEALSSMIMKCLAKNMEDRYHSAYGLMNDLINCRDQLTFYGAIQPFIPGLHDLYNQFQIPQRLYGREKESDFLEKALDRCCAGSSEMLIVHGHEGIGKSSLINEMQKFTIQRQGHFIRGKFDQSKHNIPHYAIIQAFKALIQHLLSENDEDLAKRKNRLIKALGKNGQLIIDLIPELQFIIGTQPPITHLEPELAENRFIHTFINFISAFLQKTAPLVIVLEDLQFAYPSSLKLLKHLMSDTTLHYLLLIGSYRDSETISIHSLTTTIEKIKKEGGKVETLHISPLTLKSVIELINDIFHSKSEEVETLAKLIYQKTHGNPFFIKEFLQMLYRMGLLNFDLVKKCWSADLVKIQKLKVTDNVADLLNKKIHGLLPNAQNLLKTAALIGNVFDLNLAARVCSIPVVQAELDIAQAIQDELIFLVRGTENEVAQRGKISIPSPTYYIFHHDRIHQTTLQLIPFTERKELHLKIGNALLQEISDLKNDEQVMTLVNHLNFSADLIDNEDKRLELAHLNLIAGKMAQSTIAYKTAAQYYAHGISLLKTDCWQTQYQLSFELYSNLGACQLWSGNHAFAKKTIDTVLREAKSIEEKAKIYITLMALLGVTGKYQEAIKRGIEALNLFGITLRYPMSSIELGYASFSLYAKFLTLDSSEHALKKLPFIKDEKIKLIGDIYLSISHSAMAVNPRFINIILDKQINLTLAHGISENSSTFLMTLAMRLASENFTNYAKASELSNFLIDAITHFPEAARNNQFIEAGSIVVAFWRFPFKKNLARLIQLENECNDNGNIETAVFCSNLIAIILLFSGSNLDQIYTKLLKIHERNSMQKQILISVQPIFLEFCSALKGLTEDPTDPLPKNSAHEFNENRIQQSAHVGHSTVNFIYYATLKVFLLYLHDKYEEAIALAKQIEKPFYQDLVPGLPIWTQCYFVHALSIAALAASSHSKLWCKLQLRSFLKRSKKWAETNSQNYLHLYLLIQAEVFRLSGKSQEAMHFYERAISAAEENGFHQDTAIAYEVAAKGYLSYNMPMLASSHMREAYNGYVRWGAIPKSNLLAEKYPDLLKTDLVAPINPENRLALPVMNQDISTRTTISKPDFFDIGSIMQASQIMSEEIVLDNLIEKLVRISMVNIGAERAFFILVKNNQLIVQAEISGKNESPQLQATPLEEKKNALCIAIVHYVMRIKEELLLNDASKEGHFVHDPYIKANQVKSLLCLPLSHQGKLIGILYFENNLNRGAFKPERLRVMRLLSTQMAISVENALFYANLEERVEERTAALKQAQAQLIQQEKMSSLGMLTAGIAHEIKNPLNFIINFSELSVCGINEIEQILTKHQKKFSATERASQLELMTALKANLRGIVDQGEHADAIVKRMLEHSRGKPGTIANMNLHALLEDCIKFVYHGMRAPDKVKIEKHFDSTIGIIKIAEKELNLVILNLLSNAFDSVFQKSKEQGMSFTPLVSIFTRNLGEQCEIRIRDNGFGISKEEQDKIFSPFYTTKPSGKGTGLGLSISHTIVTQQFGGTLTFNTMPGEYAEFVITFPLKPL